MNVIINPGSENKGGSLEQAIINAKNWLKIIHDEGFLEVKMKHVKKYEGGNFMFHFKHSVTKKTAKLEIHGFTDEECKKFMFHPRVYWNGSSTGNPQIEDWLTDDFNYKIVYYEK